MIPEICIPEWESKLQKKNKKELDLLNEIIVFLAAHNVMTYAEFCAIRETVRLKHERMQS